MCMAIGSVHADRTICSMLFSTMPMVTPFSQWLGMAMRCPAMAISDSLLVLRVRSLHHVCKNQSSTEFDTTSVLT